MNIDHLRQDNRIETCINGDDYTFRTTWGLFCPKEIDDGTMLLLDYLAVPDGGDGFDLGCGYGVIGAVMARQSKTGHVWLADKDFVAVEYARRNLAENGIPNASVVLSNGFDQLPADARFDVIASNLPAKVGNELYQIMFHDAHERMRPGGRFYVVTINGLREYIKREFKQVFGNYKKVKQGQSYTVAVAEKR